MLRNNFDLNLQKPTVTCASIYYAM